MYGFHLYMYKYYVGFAYITHLRVLCAAEPLMAA